jgi:molybdate-binding protein/DNA-binding transcriptional regulator YhcF (GntR family)
MDEIPLYQQIAESIRREILEGRLKAGDRLPSVRELTRNWGCTPGTVQRAYQELSRQGLLISRAGQGTTVSGSPAEMRAQSPLRKALLVNHCEAFLLEMLTGGYELAEIQQALGIAMDRWRSEGVEAAPNQTKTLRFSGSHDLALVWMDGRMDEIAPDLHLEIAFTGSLGGLMALAEGRADLAGCHLWDEESDSYNLPFVRRLLPGKRVAVVRLVRRRLGLLVPPGNPKGIFGVADLMQPGLRFANRQPGSGTRVWLDAQLARLRIDSQAIDGYQQVHLTHSSVARAVAEGKVDAGLGLEAAAKAMALDFVFLIQECYDLVMPETVYAMDGMQGWIEWLKSEAGRAEINTLPGYDSTGSGETVWC